MMTHMEKLPSVTYDSTTGRVTESDGFAWEYFAGSNLKSKLTYPNEAVVTWTYEPHRDHLTAVTNATYSTYVYANDLLGRRTSKNDERYGYNVRNELIAADEVSYNYDDIGNRTTAEGKTYTANNLNQYTAIDDFTPQYDDDGNQTLIKTETGVWSVVYNAENRPVRWTQGDTVITMAFDRMGRRVEYHETRAAVRTEFVWDPTEPIATRPLVFLPASGETAYYFHDGNKNVSEVFYHALQDGIAAHYDYAPFGAVTRTARATRVTNLDLLSENPFRFSSEYYDVTSGLVYYNYRHYASLDGRWGGHDIIEIEANSYLANKNNPICYFDFRGMWAISIGFSGSVSLLGGWTGSIGLTFSNSDENGFEFGGYIGTGPGASTPVPAASAGIQVQFAPNADGIGIFEGPSTNIGGDFGPVTGEIVIPASSPKEVIISGTLGISTPRVNVHIYAPQTAISPIYSSRDKERGCLCPCKGCGNCNCPENPNCECSDCPE